MSVVKRSIVIAGHKTSISLEDAFWKALKGIAETQRATLSDLVASIDSQRKDGNLSSAIRVYVLGYHLSGQGTAEESGHQLKPGLFAAPEIGNQAVHSELVSKQLAAQVELS